MFLPTIVARRPLLTPGNAKLGGSLIHTFSLPARSTCPGRSEACSAFCYAARGHYRHHKIRSRYEENERRSRLPSFVGDVVAEIRASAAAVVRIHGSGDFYSAEYADRWDAIARRRGGTAFYFYTRSWRDPAILAALRRLASRPNCFAWYSFDATTGEPPRDPGVRLAYAARDDAELDLVPSAADLAFRDRPATPRKRSRGVLVCPNEQRVPRASRITCDRCRICFTHYQTRRD